MMETPLGHLLRLGLKGFLDEGATCSSLTEQAVPGLSSSHKPFAVCSGILFLQRPTGTLESLGPWVMVLIRRPSGPSKKHDTTGPRDLEENANKPSVLFGRQLNEL